MFSMKCSRDSSMLESLPEPVLSEICTFMDAPGLCLADATCKSLQRATIHSWELKDKIMSLRSEAPTAKERVKKFLRASNRAFWYQTLSPMHGPSANASGSLMRCYGCGEYPDLDTRPRQVPKDYEYFCRITRRARKERGGRPEENLVLQGFLRRNLDGIFVLPDDMKHWKQLGSLLQTLTQASNDGIQTWRIDGLYDLKLAAMSNLRVTLVAVPRASIYEAPTLMIGADKYTGNRSMSTLKEMRIYFEDEYVCSHSRNPAEGGISVLYLSIALSKDQPARLAGLAFEPNPEFR
jgi:hypothetical protein